MNFKRLLVAAAATGILTPGLSYGAGNDNLLARVTSIRDQVRDQWNSKLCKIDIDWLNGNLSEIKFPNYDRKEVVQDADKIIQTLWETQLLIRKPLAQYERNCITPLRASFSALRGLIDYIGTFAYVTAAGGKNLRGEDVKWQNQPVPILDAKAYHGYLGAPGFEPGSPFKFKAGDIIMSAGFTNAPSSIITQTPDIRAEYSHIVFVEVKNNVPMTLEAYAGVGLGKYNIKFALKNENPRLMIFRQRDPELGQKAGDFMLNIVNEGIRTGNRIPFNYFAAGPERHDYLWCGEVARWAYDAVTDHKFMIPFYKNTVSRKNLGVLTMFQVSRGELFEANDLEVDPRFDALLEFRDWEVIRDVRYKAAVIREVLRWQDDYSYKFRRIGRDELVKTIYHLRKTRLWPILKAAGAPDLPPDATKEILIAFDAVSQLAPIIYNHLQKADQAHLLKTGWPMTNAELIAEVQAYRAKDAAKPFPLSDFHKYFRP